MEYFAVHLPQTINSMHCDCCEAAVALLLEHFAVHIPQTITAFVHIRTILA